MDVNGIIIMQFPIPGKSKLPTTIRPFFFLFENTLKSAVMICLTSNFSHHRMKRKRRKTLIFVARRRLDHILPWKQGLDMSEGEEAIPCTADQTAPNLRT